MGWCTKETPSYGGGACGFRVLRKTGTYRYLRTASGYPLMLTDCMEDYPVSLSVSGNAVQDGTPTPDNPVEVQSVGERTGNLFDYNVLDDTPYFINDESSIGVFTVQVPNGTYTLSTNITKNKELTGVMFSNSIPSSWSTQKHGCSFDSSRTITVTNGALYVGLYWKGDNKNTYGRDFAKVDFTNGDYWLMLNEGTTALPYEPYGYKVPLKFSGKNLFNYEHFYANKVRATDTSTNDIVFLQLKPNTTYTASTNVPFTGAAGTAWFFFRAGSSYVVPSTDIDGISDSVVRTITTDSSGQAFVAVRNSYAGYSGIPTADDFRNNTYWIQIEESETATEYEPYHEPQDFTLYLDTPLYGMNGVSDTVELDVTNRTATLTSRYRVYTFTGNETISIQEGSYYPGGQRFCISMQLGLAKERYTCPCNRFQIHKGQTNTDNTIFAFESSIYIYYSEAATVDELREFLADNETIVLIPLPEPQMTDISDKIEWDSIPKLWNGTVIISADTEIEPSDITAAYYSDKQEVN